MLWLGGGGGGTTAVKDLPLITLLSCGADDRSQGAIIGARPGLPGTEHSPSESQPSSPSPTPSPPPILEPGSEPNLAVLSIPGDTMTTGMMEVSVEESTPMPCETGEPYCISPEPTPLAEPILEVEVTLSKPIPESEFSSSPLQVSIPLASPKVEILPEPNGTVPPEDLEPELELNPELAPLPAVCSSDSPTPIAPTAQPEELLNGAPSPPAVDLSPVSEPKEQAEEVITPEAPPVILSATPAVAFLATSPAPEEEMEDEEEEEEGEAEGDKAEEELLPPESTPVPAHLSQNLEAAAATPGKVWLDGGGGLGRAGGWGSLCLLMISHLCLNVWVRSPVMAYLRV